MTPSTQLAAARRAIIDANLAIARNEFFRLRDLTKGLDRDAAMLERSAISGSSWGSGVEATEAFELVAAMRTMVAHLLRVEELWKARLADQLHQMQSEQIGPSHGRHVVPKAKGETK